MTTTSRLEGARGAKINGPDPSLTAVCTAYPTPPLLPFFHPPIELASFRPHRRLHPDRRIDFSAIWFNERCEAQAARTSSGSLLTLTISHGLRYSTGASVAAVMPR